MRYGELITFLENVGKDPTRLIFEDELTGIHNRRFLLSYLEHKVRWREGSDYPLSLLIIDVDEFKQINDTHGHDTGDQVLVWMATLLGEVADHRGLPVRFGGDEFALLLPRMGPDGAREIADRLLQRARDRAFHLRDSGMTLPVTVSVGVASAPDDARSSKELFQAADTALYHAKQSGRNQATSAWEIDPQTVFPKTALNRLKATGIVGRKEELAHVSEALEKLEAGESQFLIMEAGPGMGKTTFLETVRRSLLGDDTFSVAMVGGDAREAYRPYYLVARILVTLLNEKEDRGAEALQELSKEDAGYLAHVLPAFAEEAAAITGDEREKRRGIFTTLARFVPRIAESRPVVLLIDDLQLADEATLLLLRVLIQRNELNLFVCGASLEALHLGETHEEMPLERFYASHHQELGIRRRTLRPLEEGDIGEYLRGVFPILKMPHGFEAELARVTQGNPLFLEEVIRKLVADRKVTLAGQQWVIEPLEPGYLPRSLEEIVNQKITALDAQERELLERATTLGEDVSLSVLAGSAEMDETRVLEFLDRAEALGLVSLDFQVNDEIMRFLGKRVLEISYGSIDPVRRGELHEEVGAYQEGLYKQRLLPSASMLAYHFKRSANEEKARKYEQVQLDFSKSVFDADEAARYTGELVESEAEVERPLEAASIQHVPHVLRAIMSAVRNIQLYPPESNTIAQSLSDVKEAVDRILALNERLHLSQAQRVLLANGRRLDTSRFTMLANSFRELLTRAELQGMAFTRGVTDEEIWTLLMKLGKLKPEDVDVGFWRRFVAENRLSHVELHQVRYSRLRRRKGRTVVQQPALLEDEELGPESLTEVPKILRAFQGAAKNARLYPLDSAPVATAIQQLHQSLQGVLTARRTLTFAVAGRSLLVNGGRVDTAGYETIAENFLELMGSVGLSSMSFLSGVSTTELGMFMDALREAGGGAPDRDFWDELVVDRGLSHLAFNQRQYAVSVVQELLTSVDAVGEDDEMVVDAPGDLIEQQVRQQSESLRDALPRYGKELLVKGEHQLVRRLLQSVVADFQRQDPRERESDVRACRTLLDGLILGLQHKFAELAVTPLLAVLGEEEEPGVLQELADLLQAMAESAVQFADYMLATRILLSVKRRQEELEDGDPRLAGLLDRKLDPAVAELLEDDLKSGVPDRQERAAQVVGALGQAAIPLLIEVIKDEKDFRVRQMAARLLAEKGPEAGQQLKRALATEVTVEQRFRILEVVDGVTGDLRNELAYSLGDSSPKIRRAAFRLFERLHDDALIGLMVPLARDQDVALAKGAIRSLAHLRSAAAVDALVSILEATKEPKLAIACCQALGEIGHAAGIDALEKVLRQRRFLWFGRRWGEQVRATAAMALRQITHPRAVQILSRFAKDEAPRVRQLAGSAASEAG